MDAATCDPPIPCPSCAQAMTKRALANHDAGQVCLDLCYPCHAIWFDRNESLQLAPHAVIELFRDIHARQSEPRRALPEHLGCPRCRAPLVLTNDLAKAGRFTYWRCPGDHGRLTPFFQFLREKQFVRSLTPAELGRVRAELKTVCCSSCGAPIDLERDTACSYCKAPLAVLDADAVEKALREWSEAEKRRPVPTRASIAQAVLDLRAAESRANRDAQRFSSTGAGLGGLGGGVDLLDLAVAGLGELLGAVDLF
jgi:5-methylcytosine-specific restriction endonuclease McrA